MKLICKMNTYGTDLNGDTMPSLNLTIGKSYNVEEIGEMILLKDDNGIDNIVPKEWFI